MTGKIKNISERKLATIIGTLFIVALVLAPVASSLYDPVISSSDWLLAISDKASQMKIGSLLLFAAAVTSVSISIWLYPILKKYNQGLALSAVVFRTMEAVFYTVSAVGLLSLVGLSQEYYSSGEQTAATYHAIGSNIMLARDVSGFIFAVLAFVLGSLSYYIIFYQTKLIPRWLSIWGILACLTLLVAVIATVFSGPPFAISGTMIILAAPIALQELALGLWLIIKGFNKSAIASLSAKK